jgi:hypothetical protein
MSAKPHSNNQASEVVSVVEAQSTPDSVEQIRDILFGRQIQEYEARFSNLEKKLTNENNRLKEMIEKQLHSLEAELRAQTKEAIENLEQERQTRQSGQKELSETLQVNSGELLSELKSVQVGANQELLEVKDHLQEQKKEIYTQLDQREETLAGIFQEMSNKLANRQV